MKKLILLSAVAISIYTLQPISAQPLNVAATDVSHKDTILTFGNDKANGDTVKQTALLSTNYTSAIFKRPLRKKNIDATQPFRNVSDDSLQANLNKKIAANMERLPLLYAYDTVRADKRPKMPLNIGYLKQQVSLITNDTLKAQYYHQIADHYLKYDSIATRRARIAYQDAALEFTLKAVHSYSRYNDIQGLRTSFNNLTKVYRDQRKFPQAKWFVLQSNSISRQLNDVPNIVSSLVQLAGIKMQIKDYSLAMRDLNEALSLTSKYKLAKQESDVQEAFAALYDKTNKPKLAAVANKRHDDILDSLINSENAKQIAVVHTQDSLQQAKKKLYTSISKKSYKTNSPKKTVSL